MPLCLSALLLHNVFPISLFSPSALPLSPYSFIFSFTGMTTMKLYLQLSFPSTQACCAAFLFPLSCSPTFISLCYLPTTLFPSLSTSGLVTATREGRTLKGVLLWERMWPESNIQSTLFHFAQPHQTTLVGPGLVPMCSCHSMTIPSIPAHLTGGHLSLLPTRVVWQLKH